MVLVNCFRMLLNLSDEILLNSAFHYQLQLSSSSWTVLPMFSLESNRINFDLGTSDARISILIYRRDEKTTEMCVLNKDNGFTWKTSTQNGIESKSQQRGRFFRTFPPFAGLCCLPISLAKKVTQSSGMINRSTMAMMKFQRKQKTNPPVNESVNGWKKFTDEWIW